MTDGHIEILSSVQAVEVSRPNAAYELVIKCRLDRGMAIPKGRINLPIDTGARRQDRILVFAEGRDAEAAKKAGADIVGGLELADGVCPLPFLCISKL
jgi:large subunit ribosomal protein L1